MWQQEIQGIKKFQDLQITDRRLPIINKLQSALISSKPKNSYHFIKKWAQKQMRELQSSSQEEYINEKPQQKVLENHKLKPIKSNMQTKRRNAIVMAKIPNNQQWIQFLNKEPLLKNEERKSRIMISLRQIPFLVNLGWDDINSLVDEAEVRQYSKDQIFVGKGQCINRLYILLQGQIIKMNFQGKPVFVNEGSNMFMESIISLTYANNIYRISSEKAAICGIEAYRIYELLQEVSRRKQEQYQKILMKVNLFNFLDNQQLYKLICMIKILPPKRPNDVVLQKDAPVDKLYLVLKGQFLLCKLNLKNQITSFQTYQQGQVFGENWLMSPCESECSVIAKTQGILGVISKGELQSSISSIERLLQRKKARQLQLSK